MTTQINTQEILKKNFINIFEISLLFDVSGITARRHIHGILKEIELLKDKLKLSTQKDEALITQELNALLGKVRKRVVGQTKDGEDIFILELAKEEALAKWGLRPAVVQENPDFTAQTAQAAPEPVHLTTQKPDQEIISDEYSKKYISLLETQLVEKDSTIKDLRETNKFLSITNGKLNEQLKLLLEKPKGGPIGENQ